MVKIAKTMGEEKGKRITTDNIRDQFAEKGGCSDMKVW